MYCCTCTCCILCQLSQLVVNSGGVAAVIDYIGESKGNIRLPGIMMLGYVAAHSEVLAMAVIVSKVSSKQVYRKVLLLTELALFAGGLIFSCGH